MSACEHCRHNCFAGKPSEQYGFQILWPLTPMSYSTEIPYHVLLPRILSQSGIPVHMFRIILFMLPEEGACSAINLVFIRVYRKKLVAPTSPANLRMYVSDIMRDVHLWEGIDMMAHGLASMIAPSSHDYIINSYWLFVRAVVWVILDMGIKPAPRRGCMAKSNAKLLSLICRSPSPRDSGVNLHILIAIHRVFCVLVGVLELDTYSSAFEDIKHFAQVLRIEYVSKGFPTWHFETGCIFDAVGDQLAQLPDPFACNYPGITIWLRRLPDVGAASQEPEATYQEVSISNNFN